MADHHRRLSWSDHALGDLVELADVMPTATRAAVGAMESRADAGFNYGRRTSESGVWYLPVQKLGVFYTDVAGLLTVGRVVDARRLTALP